MARTRCSSRRRTANPRPLRSRRAARFRARPRTCGRQPANSPTQPAASIWNGSHGPTPPVSNALPKSVSMPSTKPKPRPSTRPAGISKKNTGEAPDASMPSGRNAAPHAVRTASNAMAFASMPPSANSASTTTSSSGNTIANTQGASPVCAELAPVALAGSKNGHRTRARRPHSRRRAQAPIAGASHHGRTSTGRRPCVARRDRRRVDGGHGVPPRVWPAPARRSARAAARGSSRLAARTSAMP